jgi:hypothetical protein
MKNEIRFSNKRNPLGLEIGDRIRYKRSCTVGYDSDGKKKLWFNEVAGFARVIGVVRKATGQYVKGSDSGPSFGGDPPEYEQAYLSVDKYHLLYECRADIYDKSFFVHPEDIVCGQ